MAGRPLALVASALTLFVRASRDSRYLAPPAARHARSGSTGMVGTREVFEGTCCRYASSLPQCAIRRAGSSATESAGSARHLLPRLSRLVASAFSRPHAGGFRL